MTWTTRIGDRIAELERCLLVNPDDRLGRQGAGPRAWVGDRPLD